MKGLKTKNQIILLLAVPLIAVIVLIPSSGSLHASDDMTIEGEVTPIDGILMTILQLLPSRLL
jgi:hypothetical protein